MMNAGIFKKYDIRGTYPSEVNEEVFFEIGRALGKFFRRGKIIAGRDARLSSPKLYQAVINGLKQPPSDLKIISAGLMTTPMFYFLVNKFQARGGIMITASHNPKESNGMKIVGGKAIPISGSEVFKLMKNNGK